MGEIHPFNSLQLISNPNPNSDYHKQNPKTVN